MRKLLVHSWALFSFFSELNVLDLTVLFTHRDFWIFHFRETNRRYNLSTLKYLYNCNRQIFLFLTPAPPPPPLFFWWISCLVLFESSPCICRSQGNILPMFAYPPHLLIFTETCSSDCIYSVAKWNLKPNWITPCGHHNSIQMLQLWGLPVITQKPLFSSNMQTKCSVSVSPFLHFTLFEIRVTTDIEHACLPMSGRIFLIYEFILLF